MRTRSRILLFPVGRVLTVIVMAYLCGIGVSVYCWLPAPVCALACAGLAAAMVLCVRRRRFVLPAALLVAFALGNCVAGTSLSLRDAPTAPGTQISGTVARIESENRVLLDNVRLGDGRETNRRAAVTLMAQEGEPMPDMPKVGQTVWGEGRLFAQDEVRNPGGMDGRLYAINRGYELSGYLLPGWTAQGEESFSLTEAFRRLRMTLAERIRLLFGGDAPLFLAVLIGERGEIDGEMTAAMRLTGTAHILSISGMHLSLISSALYAVLRRLPVGKRAAAVIHVSLLLLFAGMTGWAVGTVRALVMALMYMLAKARARRYDRLTALSAAALLITVCRPLMFFDGGFRFSFFVVLGICLLEGPVSQLRPMRLLHRRLPWFAELLTVSLCAQLAAMPMQLILYGYIPVLSLPMNLICAMMMPVFMVGGWGVVAVGLLSTAVGSLTASALGAAANCFESVSLFAAGLRFGVLRLPSPGSLALLLGGALMALVSTKIRLGRGRRCAFGALLVLSAALYLPRFDPAPRYVQLDVGQGDASLIRSGRSAVIIDVGPAYSYDLVRYLRHEGLFVDAVILSHLDEDHAGALSALLSSEIGVGCVVMAEGAQEECASSAVLEGLYALGEAGVEVLHVRRGDELRFGGAQISVLSPDETLRGSNERSLLLFVCMADKTILMTGDLPASCEPESVPDCDVLKIAHHGSKNATSAEFLASAKPELAIISVGKDNTYGHPHARVIDDLLRSGAQILRTDLSGCITVRLRGKMTAEAMNTQSSGDLGGAPLP